MKFLLWIARVWSVASLLLLFAIVMDGANNAGGKTPTVVEWSGLLFFPGGIFVGLLTAWRWPKVGGLVTLFSLIGFYVWHLIVSGGLPDGPWFVLIAAPGVLMRYVTRRESLTS